MSSTCTTWHVRIDLVGDEDGLAARAKLVGAPLVASCAEHGTYKPGCPACRDVRDYTAWQDLPEVVESLVGVLQRAHRAQAGRESGSATLVAPTQR